VPGDPSRAHGLAKSRQVPLLQPARTETLGGVDGFRVVVVAVDDDAARRCVGQHEFGDLDTVHAGWHSVVDDEHVGTLAVARGHGAGTIGHRGGDDMTLETQIEGDQIERVPVVVGDHEAHVARLGG
jgi:hypothetical protein